MGHKIPHSSFVFSCCLSTSSSLILCISLCLTDAGNTRHGAMLLCGSPLEAKYSTWWSLSMATWSSSFSRCCFISWKACSSPRAVLTWLSIVFTFFLTASSSFLMFSTVFFSSVMASSRSRRFSRSSHARLKREGSHPMGQVESSSTSSSSLPSSEELRVGGEREGRMKDGEEEGEGGMLVR